MRRRFRNPCKASCQAEPSGAEKVLASRCKKECAMSVENKKLTTNAGCPVVDNQNVMTAGPRGPQLLQGVWFRTVIFQRSPWQ